MYYFGADGVDLTPYLIYITIVNNDSFSSSGSNWDVETNIYKNGSYVAGPSAESTSNSMNVNDITIKSPYNQRDVSGKEGENMLRFKIACSVGILLALAIVGIAWFTNAATATSVKPPAPPPIHRAFQISQTYLAGDPAIHPHLTQNGAGPTFTRDDVIAFFSTNGFFAGPVAPGAHLKFLTIQFVTAKQASQLMYGESIGRPDNALVCYVKVQGPFLLTNIHGAPPRPNVKAPTTAEYGDEVFDAHTGNLLIWGVYYQ